jgi:hypothetical protein
MKNQKKTVVDQGKRIVLKYNEDVTGAACYFCGLRVEDDGFDFFVEGTNEFRVCEHCAKEKAPDLYEIWRDAHRWNEEMDIKSFREGVKAGKEEAGQMIIDTIDEPVISRVERVCRVDLDAKPFREVDIPF